MNNPMLPLPNPGDWYTTYRTAQELGVGRKTIQRLVEDRVLTEYSPETSGSERIHPMFWRPQVEAVRDARKLVKGARS